MPAQRKSKSKKKIKIVRIETELFLCAQGGRAICWCACFDAMFLPVLLIKPKLSGRRWQMRGDKERPFGTAVTNYGRVWRKGAGKRGLECAKFPCVRKDAGKRSLECGKFPCVRKDAGKRGWDNACRAVGSGDFNTVFTKTLVHLICHFPDTEVNTLHPPHFSIQFNWNLIQFN